jgi:hypothetical protein
MKRACLYIRVSKLDRKAIKDLDDEFLTADFQI